MPIEYALLKHKPEKYSVCPACKAFPFSQTIMPRGMVQRKRRFLGFLWKQDYCSIICDHCMNIVGHESP